MPTKRDKRLFNLAELLAAELNRSKGDVQPEDIVNFMQCNVPMTDEEADEDFEETKREMSEHPSPGRLALQRLRTALGFVPGDSLISVMEKAAEVRQRVRDDDSSGITAKRFKGFWCPDVCPITLLPFFMWIEHPEFGWVPTYGGPYDSYTIPEPEDGKCKNRFDVEYIRYRFDHDEGGWRIDEVEAMTERVIHEETLIELNAWPDER